MAETLEKTSEKQESSYVGQILGDRYVVLEELRTTSSQVICAVYDISDLKRSRVAIDRHNAEGFELLPEAVTTRPEKIARPTPSGTLRPRPERQTPSKASPPPPPPFAFNEDEKTASTLGEAKEVAELSGKELNELAKKTDVDHAPAGAHHRPTVRVMPPTTPPPLPESLLQQPRLRVRTRQFEAAWFAQSDDADKLSHEQEWEHDPFGVHQGLVVEAQQLSTEEVNRWALDLNTGKFRYVAPPATAIEPKNTSKTLVPPPPAQTTPKAVAAQSTAPSTAEVRTPAKVGPSAIERFARAADAIATKAPVLWATKPRILAIGLSLGLLAGLLL